MLRQAGREQATVGTAAEMGVSSHRPRNSRIASKHQKLGEDREDCPRVWPHEHHDLGFSAFRTEMTYFCYFTTLCHRSHKK